MHGDHGASLTLHVERGHAQAALLDHARWLGDRPATRSATDESADVEAADCPDVAGAPNLGYRVRRVSPGSRARTVGATTCSAARPDAMRHGPVVRGAAGNLADVSRRRFAAADLGAATPLDVPLDGGRHRRHCRAQARTRGLRADLDVLTTRIRHDRTSPVTVQPKRSLKVEKLARIYDDEIAPVWGTRFGKMLLRNLCGARARPGARHLVRHRLPDDRDPAPDDAKARA